MDLQCAINKIYIRFTLMFQFVVDDILCSSRSIYPIYYSSWKKNARCSCVTHPTAARRSHKHELLYILLLLRFAYNHYYDYLRVSEPKKERERRHLFHELAAEYYSNQLKNLNILQGIIYSSSLEKVFKTYAVNLCVCSKSRVGRALCRAIDLDGVGEGEGVGEIQDEN